MEIPCQPQLVAASFCQGPLKCGKALLDQGVSLSSSQLCYISSSKFLYCYRVLCCRAVRAGECFFMAQIVSAYDNVPARDAG